MTLNDARDYCKNRNQFLVVPKDQDETDKIRAMVGNGNKRAWVGINRKSGSWESDDSTCDLSWLNWNSGEGNDGNVGDGAAMVWQRAWNGQWYDMPGDDGRKHSAVCASSCTMDESTGNQLQ